MSFTIKGSREMIAGGFLVSPAEAALLAVSQAIEMRGIVIPPAIDIQVANAVRDIDAEICQAARDLNAQPIAHDADGRVVRICVEE